MIVVGFSGDGIDDKRVAAARKEVAAGDIGGVMFLKTNVASRKAVEAMNAAFRAAAPEGLPPFITLDQEGGLAGTPRQFRWLQGSRRRRDDREELYARAVARRVRRTCQRRA